MTKLRLVLTLAISIVAGVVAFRSVPPPVPVVTKEEFIAEARTGHVTQVVIRDGDYALAVSSSRGEILLHLKKDENADLIRQLSGMGVRVMYETTPLL